MKKWETKNGYKIIQVLSGRSNVYLLTNGKTNILIDTSPKYKWNKLENNLNKLNINHIEYLILTHTHFDHAANAFTIRDKYHVEVIVHKNEAQYLTSGENTIPKGTNFLTKKLVNLFAENYLKRVNYQPCQYDILVGDSFDLNEFGFNAYIMHTPGHSEGSMSVILEDEIAIVGDAMFGIFKWSVFPPYASDTNQMINSWGKLLDTNCSIFIPSHGWENKRSLVENNYNKRLNAK